MEDRIRWYVNNDLHDKAYVLALLGDHLEANFEKTLVFLPKVLTPSNLVSKRRLPRGLCVPPFNYTP